MFRSQGYTQPFVQQQQHHHQTSPNYASDLMSMEMQERRMNEKDGAGDSGDGQMDKTKLIVNYIPQFATEDELAVIFGKAGQVENIRIMRDFRTGYSYGFGFVKYTKPEFAAKAIETINGMNFKNKRLKVSYSRPPGQDMRDSNLYITNLPKNVTEEDIDRMFGTFGEIIQRTILKDKITGMPRGVAFVRFSKTEEAQAAIADLDGKQLKNAMLPLKIHVAEDHGRQKAQYMDYVNHVCLYNNRGVKPCRGGGGGLPFREIHVPRGNFMVRGTCPFANFQSNNRCVGMGAGDNPYQNPVFW